MQVKFLKKDKNHLEFLLIGERHTLPNLLRNQLLQDPDVSFASYTLDHPLATEAKFILKTGSKAAKTVLNKALSDIESELTDFESAVKKAVK